jgi:NADPH-dependent 2,4-dienoyl-CoA reductase/sulfur reductase-like enzyme
MMFDVAVVGAGPAGLAAAQAATSAGADVAVVDAGVRAGGQYLRSFGDGPRPRPGWRHELRGDGAGTTHLAAHHVWRVSPSVDGFTLHCLVGAEPRQRPVRPLTVHTRRLVLATGAYDRQLPFPGWELPGVLTAGGAQALLKGNRVVAGQTIVVAGTGPFLLPVATGLAAAGARVAAVIEANNPLGFARFPSAVPSAKLAEAFGYGARLVRHRIPFLRGHAVVRALGAEHLEAVVVAGRDGRSRTIACDVLAVGWGFTPQLELHLQVGCATRVDADGSLVVAVDDDQRTSVDGVWAAGESTGVGGADLAGVEGTIAGFAAAGRPAPDALRRRRTRLRAFANAMHRVYPVPFDSDLPDDTLVCRCEAVPAGAVRRAVDELGATDARTVKLLARPGMGWCQGRVCGYAVARLTARLRGRDVEPADLLAFAERPIATPTPLGVLADEQP